MLGAGEKRKASLNSFMEMKENIFFPGNGV
jgi:hypothetical protein